MFINIDDYSTASQLQAALDSWILDEGAAYLNRVDYALERDCLAEEYLLAIMLMDESLDIDLQADNWIGFEGDWPYVSPTYSITYNNQAYVATSGPATYTTDGDAIVVTATSTQPDYLPLFGEAVIFNIEGYNSDGNSSVTVYGNPNGEAELTFAVNGIYGNISITTSIYQATATYIIPLYHASPAGISQYLIPEDQWGMFMYYDVNNATLVGIGDSNADGVLTNTDVINSLSVYGTANATDQFLETSLSAENYLAFTGGQTVTATVSALNSEYPLSRMKIMRLFGLAEDGLDIQYEIFDGVSSIEETLQIPSTVGDAIYYSLAVVDKWHEMEVISYTPILDITTDSSRFNGSYSPTLSFEYTTAETGNTPVVYQGLLSFVISDGSTMYAGADYGLNQIAIVAPNQVIPDVNAGGIDIESDITVYSLLAIASYANRITVETDIAGNSISYWEVLTPTLADYYYNYDTPANISMTLTPLLGIDLEDYNITYTIVENGVITNNYQNTVVVVGGGVQSFQLPITSLPQTPTHSLKVVLTITEA